MTGSAINNVSHKQNDQAQVRELQKSDYYKYLQKELAQKADAVKGSG
jgi:hypothetical protein